jgi:hypothetical protein
LDNFIQIFINNYQKFINYIVDELDYIQLCKDYNILFFCIDDITSFGEYDFKDVKNEYINKYKNKIILFY